MKYGKLFLAVAFFAVVAPMALADNGTSNETMEAVPFHCTWGAKMRLFELEKSIVRNILWGKGIVDEIKAKNASADTTELESIIAELDALKIEVNSTDPVSGEESAQKFVDLKSDAMNLTRDFRELAKPMLSSGEIKNLTKKLGKLNDTEMDELREKIEEARREYNAEKISEILRNAGVNDTVLIERIKAGNLTKKNVTDALNITNKKAGHIYQIIKENAQKNRIFARALVDKVLKNRAVREQNRLENRIELVKHMNLSDKIVSRVEWRINQTGKRIERIEDREEKRIDHVMNLTDKKIGKLENLSAKLANHSESIGNGTVKKQGHIDQLINKTLNKGQYTKGKLEKLAGGKEE